MRIQPLTATYQCTLDEIEALVGLHRLTCCEPAGEPFVALRFPRPNDALAFKLAVSSAVIDDEVAFMAHAEAADAKEALDRLSLEADWFDCMQVWIWNSQDKDTFDAAFGHRVQ